MTHHGPIHRPEPRVAPRVVFSLVVLATVVGVLWWNVDAGRSHPGSPVRIAYNGGRVLYAPRVYAIYADPTRSAADVRGQARINQFLKDLPTSRYLTVVRTYQQRAARRNSHPALGMAAYDPARQSAVVGGCPTSPCRVGPWIQTIAAKHHWPIGLRSIFVLLLPRGDSVKALEPHFSANVGGYHTAWTNGDGQTLLGAVVSGADSPVPKGTVHPGQLVILSHELVETVTDPTGHGWLATRASCAGAAWFDCGDREVADVCTPIRPNGAPTTIGRNSYVLELYAAPDGTCQNGSSTFQADSSPPLDTVAAGRPLLR